MVPTSSSLDCLLDKPSSADSSGNKLLFCFRCLLPNQRQTVIAYTLAYYAAAKPFLCHSRTCWDNLCSFYRSDAIPVTQPSVEALNKTSTMINKHIFEYCITIKGILAGQRKGSGSIKSQTYQGAATKYE